MKHIPIERWGKDHWSTFAYVETLAVDSGNKGLAIPVKERMRTNEKTHPHLIGNCCGSDALNGSRYPTRLKDGELKGHDDWACLDDAVEAGLLTDEGSGLNRAFKLTKLGKEIANQLRNHKTTGGVFQTFEASLRTKPKDLGIHEANP